MRVNTFQRTLNASSEFETLQKKNPVLPIFTIGIRHMETIEPAQACTAAPLRWARGSCRGRYEQT